LPEATSTAPPARLSCRYLFRGAPELEPPVTATAARPDLVFARAREPISPGRLRRGAWDRWSAGALDQRSSALHLGTERPVTLAGSVYGSLLRGQEVETALARSQGRPRHASARRHLRIEVGSGERTLAQPSLSRPDAVAGQLSSRAPPPRHASESPPEVIVRTRTCTGRTPPRSTHPFQGSLQVIRHIGRPKESSILLESAASEAPSQCLPPRTRLVTREKPRARASSALDLEATDQLPKAMGRVTFPNTGPADRPPTVRGWNQTGRCSRLELGGEEVRGLVGGLVRG
jgi:hypothetical protein